MFKQRPRAVACPAARSDGLVSRFITGTWKPFEGLGPRIGGQRENDGDNNAPYGSGSRLAKSSLRPILII